MVGRDPPCQHPDRCNSRSVGTVRPTVLQVLSSHDGASVEGERLALALSDLGVEATYRGLERRGAAADALQFVLAADWQTVRDTLIASAIAAGAGAGAKAAAMASKLLLKKLRETRRSSGVERFILRDTDAGLELTLNAEALDGDWDGLLDLPSSPGRYVWDGKTSSWREDD